MIGITILLLNVQFAIGIIRAKCQLLKQIKTDMSYFKHSDKMKLIHVQSIPKKTVILLEPCNNILMCKDCGEDINKKKTALDTVKKSW